MQRHHKPDIQIREEACGTDRYLQQFRWLCRLIILLYLKSKLQWTLMICPFGRQRSVNTSRQGGQSRISPQTNCQSMHHGRSQCPTSRSSLSKCQVSGDLNNPPLGSHLSLQLLRTVAVLGSFSAESNHEWIS